MTESYKRGFVRRCNERGVDPNAVVKYAEYVNAREAVRHGRLTKAAQAINFATAPNMGYAGAGAGALLGGAVGALSSRKNRLRNFILGAILGGSVGGAGGYVAGHNIGPETMARLNAWLNKAYKGTKDFGVKAYGKAKALGSSAVGHTVATAKEVKDRTVNAAKAVAGKDGKGGDAGK